MEENADEEVVVIFAGHSDLTSLAGVCTERSICMFISLGQARE